MHWCVWCFLMSSSDVFSRMPVRKRSSWEVTESSPFEENQYSKKHRVESEQQSSFLHSTCGEYISSQDDFWDKEHLDGLGCTSMENEEVDNFVSTSFVVKESLQTPPVGHKGRSMSDYCTVISAKKFKGSNLNKSVHFLEETSMVVVTADEPIKTDAFCHGCKSPVTDGTYLLQCNFCSRSFCGTGCVCSCEHCGGTFCHSTCSTLNYAAVFARTLCLDCNTDSNAKGNYYSM